VGDDAYRVTLKHDPWCPLLRVIEERKPGLARSQLVIYPKPGDE
jgi:hypothetical protein